MKNIIKSLFTFTILSAVITTTALPAYADNSTNQVQQSVPPTTTQLVDKFGNRIDELLTTLASKAGVAVDHFYPIFVFQQRIVGITDFSIMIVLLISVIFLLRFGCNNAIIYKSADSYSRTSNNAEIKMMFGYTAGCMLGAVFIIFTLTQFSDTVGQIVNPEFYAIKNLVSMVR